MTSKKLCRDKAYGPIVLTLVAALAQLNSANAWESQKIPVVNGRLTYAADAEGNRIPDFSNAGYRGGNANLPNVTRVVGNIAAGSTLAQINAAIAAANVSESNPGVLVFAAGDYSIDGTIFINKSGLVLRGAGDGRSGGPATRIIQTGTANGQQIIRISSSALVLTNGDAQKESGELTGFLDKTSGRYTAITTPLVPVGARSFAVASTSTFAVGDAVVIDYPIVPDGEAFSPWRSAVDTEGWWSMPELLYLQEWSIQYHRYITKISGNTITLDAPVFDNLNSSFATSTLYHYNRTGVIREVGIENIEVVGEYVDPGSSEASNTRSGTKDAIVFSGVENCWVRGVSGTQLARACVVFLGGSSRSTVLDSRGLPPVLPVSEGRAYGFAAEGAQLILFEDCFVDGHRHAFITNGKVWDSGIAVVNGTVVNAKNSVEMHRYWGQAMLLDNLTFANSQANAHIRFINRQGAGLHTPVDPADAPGHGWSAAHSVIWGCTGDGNKPFSIQKPNTAQNYAIGSMNVAVNGKFLSSIEGIKGYEEGTGQSGLYPQSLYLAQLGDRLVATQTPAYQHATTAPVTFTGTNYVDGGTANGSGSRLTVAFFATPSSMATSMSVVDKLPLTGTAGWSVKIRNSGAITFRIGSEAAGSRTDIDIATGTVVLNQRKHIAFTFADGTARVYIDGVQVPVTVNGVTATEATGIVHTVNNTTTNLRLGVPSVASLSNVYKGTLEQVNIFNDTLDGFSIAKLANPTTANWKHDGPTWLNGTTDVINGGTSTITGTSMTFAGYVTVDKLATQPSLMTLVDKLPNTSTAGTGGWSIKLRNTGVISVRIGSEASGARFDLDSSPGMFTPFQRVHIACTFTAGTLKLYVNGQAAALATGITQTVNNTADPLLLGKSSLSSATGLQGLLESVKVYNSALTEAQIRALMD